MTSKGFYSQTFGPGNNQRIMALVTGFNGQLADLEKAAHGLVAAGYDVVTYAYDNDVFLSGDGQVLLGRIDAMSRDFEARAQNHAMRQYAGISLGSGIAWNMQKLSCASTVLPGIYAAGGADAAKLVMHNRLFRASVRHAHKVDFKKQFLKNDYDEAALQQLWSDSSRPPDNGFVLVLGGRDIVVRPQAIKQQMQVWRSQGLKFTTIHQAKLGHRAVAIWFLNNMPMMLAAADDLKAQLDSQVF
ncbi:MAG: hypothetical protein ACREGA_02395 [Candidatus Saccharimonadales bacterium]